MGGWVGGWVGGLVSWSPGSPKMTPQPTSPQLLSKGLAWAHFILCVPALIKCSPAPKLAAKFG